MTFLGISRSRGPDNLERVDQSRLSKRIDETRGRRSPGCWVTLAFGVCAGVTPVSPSTAWCAAHYAKGVRLFRTMEGGRPWGCVDPPI